MIIRMEIRVDGKLMRVEEVEVDPTSGNRIPTIWNFLHNAKKLLDSLCVADFIYFKG